MDGSIEVTSRLTGALSAVAAAAAGHDRDASFPHDSLSALHSAGLLGLAARRQDGGQEIALRDATYLAGEVGRACAATGLVFGMQLIHVNAAMRNPRWPDAVKSLVGRSAVQDGGLVNTLRVEPALGTPARGGLPDTIARRTADGWQITGHKRYATGIPGLAWLLPWARTDEAEPRVGYFLVPNGAPGITVVDAWDHLGLRASGSHDVLLQDVAIPAEFAVDIRPPGAWGTPDPHQPVWNTALVGALYTGVARAARDWVVDFLRDRAPSNLGAPLATLPRMQEAVGEIDALLATNARLIDSVARDYDECVAIPGTENGLIKAIVSENAISAVKRALKLTGNHGLSRANPLERHLRDVLCARVHSPQADSAHVAAGRAALLQEKRP